MTDFRIKNHSILPVLDSPKIPFYWKDQEYFACVGDTIASALLVNGVRVFGHHPKDNAPQSIFCANGQCSQCMVIANGLPVKSCMELLKPQMRVFPADKLPTLTKVDSLLQPHPIETIRPNVLIIGGGPAGLSAAIELGKLNISTILVDDKNRLGGKLVLQTHKFFGSTETVYAGTRGIDIASKLKVN